MYAVSYIVYAYSRLLCRGTTRLKYESYNFASPGSEQVLNRDILQLLDIATSHREEKETDFKTVAEEIVMLFS